MCNTQKEIRKAYYDGWSLEKRYAEDPCQEMRTIDFKSNSVRLSEGTPTRSKYQIIVVYPFKAKIITQLQEVDVHTLIGNIGGYIGLFLGKLRSQKNMCTTSMIVKNTVTRLFSILI